MFEDTILHMGKPEFPAKLFKTLRHECQIRRMVISRYDRERRQEYLALESDRPMMTFARVDRIYDVRYSQRNPSRMLFGPDRSRHVSLNTIEADSLPDREYAQLFFYNLRFSARSSIILRTSEQALVVNLYRGRDEFVTHANEVAFLRRHGTNIAALVERHYELMHGRPKPADSVSFAEGLKAKGLSDREATICTMIVRGYTNEAISLQLGISPHSATTYRRRAYAKLDISSQAELFARLIDLSCARVHLARDQ